ncbi:MAG: magnesium-translocating P-type ATPase [Candidatus Omnitrophica bacterium CG07_land_8_20_14_0_80_42_15]|uniref:Magnesium-transporting ATPase, P-type 1 n=1 Tax=Candidatus Aquitaenariimonas noxiae TaxID=1974741 RepID=A0A2J0KUP8_9BACT|nr:MAG: magnesium-translocating P-type ATPase [Candidatus Omnitrophica bacterium CG07_land_8_20_14_0_80_42_15]
MIDTVGFKQKQNENSKTNGNRKQQLLDFDYVNCGTEDLFKKFKTSLKGLSDKEVKLRLEEYGYNEPAKKKKRTILFQIASKFINPLVIVLLIIAGFSLFFGERMSALLIILMAMMSVFLSFLQEHRAGKEAEKLSEMVRATATVYRNGRPKEVKIKEIVPGDIVDLFAGDMIPADLRLISCKDLFVNQASLTGESFPIEKSSDAIKPNTNAVTDLTNIAFMGSSVVSGTGLGVVIKTGLSTQFGELSRKLASIVVETSFDKGISKFTWLMIRFMLVLVIAIFSINALSKGNPLQALLFSLAVAVGLTPEMLPMLVAINLSKGAIAMSKKDVIVKRLNSIQNFGAMDVLCTDKTGTLTLDRIVLEKHCDVVRNESDDVLRFAYINSFYQTGLKNILDRAVLKYEKLVVNAYKKIDEVPFDFSRKIMSVVIEADGRHRIITKGAPEEIFKRCSQYELDGDILDMEQLILMDLKTEYDNLSSEGFRVLAVAYKDFDNKKEVYSKEDEQQLTLKGYIAFLDPPKPTAKKTIEVLKSLGIEFKVLTGDNELVTKKICSEVGLDVKGLLTGDRVEGSNDSELKELVKTTNVFARLSPLQKERVIHALHENKHIVGYLGDGINDAPALKASDVGISVNNAVDIAKESADIILLKKSLMVLEDGVLEGRKTFGNILKYIKMGSSSNLGNMISMTGASLFLPFLPMLPIQILLNNFLYDLSQAAIPTDGVDNEYLARSRPWNMGYIKKFMLFIGPISSIFDFITFGVLLFIFHASQPLFNTGWFLESLCTQTLVIHVIRTGKKPFIESRPSQFLIFTSIYIVTIALFMPFIPLGRHFGFVTPPPSFFLALFVIVAFYLFMVEFVKRWFIKRYGYE